MTTIRLSSDSSDRTVRTPDVSAQNFRHFSDNSDKNFREEDESGDEFQDEIHFDPTISSGHLGFRDVSCPKNRELSLNFVHFTHSCFKYLTTIWLSLSFG
jgi:hypothetical protein